MVYDDRDRVKVRNPVLFISAVAWILLLAGPRTLTHCPVAASGVVPWRASLQMLVAMQPLASLATGWVLMLVAMMSPVLISPMRHVWLQSFQHRRTRSIGLFVAGYVAIWLLAGTPLLAVELVAALFARQWYLPAAGILTALLWQFSPVKQHCLNHGHVHPPLAAFGLAADWDALCFGANHGVWCVGSCWALMIFPDMLPRWHATVMAAVAFLILSERLDQPNWPRWSLCVSGKLMRILLAQTQIRLNSPRLARGWRFAGGPKT